MKLKEENKILKDLVLTLNAYIPHCCYNCHFFEQNIGDSWCYKHDRKSTKNDGCSCFELQNGIYEKARKIGVEL